MKKGLSDAVFIPKWSTEKFVKTAGEAGFTGVELNVREDQGDLTLHTSGSEARTLVDQANAYGVEVPTLSTGLFNVYALSSGKSDVRKRGEDIAFRMIELAAKMNVPIIQVVPGVLSADEAYEESYGRAKESLRRLGDDASSVGVTLAVENVCNKFLPSPLEFVHFLDEIDHPNVRAYFDNGNAMVTGVPEHFISLLGNRIVATHVKDYRESVRDFVNMLDGDINWPVMIEALEQIPYTGYVMVTPPYPRLHAPERLIHTASHDLSTILELSRQHS